MKSFLPLLLKRGILIEMRKNTFRSYTDFALISTVTGTGMMVLTNS